ncbi:hypothetical protein RJ641_034689 [Dillenia turbinata]|uniref:Uncharacterized protein n=1 Tax=Dillenia turbinata TaxID=194707 RepID=A0AAN8VMP1_9MAGN
MGPDHPHYSQTSELEERQTADHLNCTTWSGAGPGLMDAATKGALQAGWRMDSHKFPSLSSIRTLQVFLGKEARFGRCCCKKFSTDGTAVVALPSGIGALD